MKLTRTACAVLTMVFGILLATMSPAAAAAPVTDSFEPPPAAQNWQFFHVGDGTGNFDNIQVRTGVRDVFIASRSVTGWSTVYRTVTVPAGLSCSASIWVNPASSGTDPKVSFEILTVNNTYLSLQTKALDDQAPYTVFSGVWHNTPGTFQVRVSIGTPVEGNTAAAWVDDLTYFCA